MRRYRVVAAAVVLVFFSSVLEVATASDPVSGLGLPTAGPLEESRPDVVSARLLARESGRRVEVLDLREETSATYATPSGTFETEIGAGPLHARADGRWEQIDTTLVRSGVRIRPRVGGADVSFSAGGSEPAVTLQQGGTRFALSWPGRLPSPRLDGPTATYADVAPGVDFVLTASRTGFEQFLVLKERPASSAAFRLPVSVTGAALSKTADGGLRLTAPDGSVVAQGPPARMWGHGTDERTGDPRRWAALPVTVTHAELRVVPDQAFLADPDVAYPVVLDPAVTFNRTHDTWVQTGYSADGSNFDGSNELRVGFQGVARARTLMKFDVASLAGKRVASATVKLWNYQSSTCTPKDVSVREIGAAWTSSTVTWNNQPGVYATVLARESSAHGYAGCPDAAWVGLGGSGLVDLVSRWANGASPNHGVSIRADESDTSSFRKFTSAEHGTNPPNLLVGYNSYPAITSVPSPPNNGYVRSADLALRAAYSDPDGNAGYVNYEIYTHPAGALVATGQSGSTTSGGVASWSPPALVDGQTYRWRARAYDGSDHAVAYYATQYLTVDNTAPAAPVVTSTDHPAGSWAGAHGQTGRFSFAPGANTDVVGYYYGLDDNPPRTYTTNAYADISPDEGPRHLYVRSVDRAGNLGPVADYAFSVGGGSLLSPQEGDRTAKRLVLRATGQAGFTGVTFEYRRAAIDTWTTVPVAHVAYAGGGAVSWPVALTAGAHATVEWDAAASLANVDGPFQVRASFTGANPGASRAAPVTLDRKNSAAATDSVGGGAVNLLTGNLSLSATDVSVASYGSDLTVSRSYNSRSPLAGSTGPYGPGWTSGVSVEAAGSSYVELSEAGSLRTVELADGDTIGFTATSPTAFTPEEGAEGLSLTRTAGAGTPGDPGDDVYELADLEGNKTVFTMPAGTQSFLPETVVQPGSGQSTSYTYETAAGVTRVARVLAPVPADVSCVTPLTTRGCRSLGLNYTPAGTPAPGNTPATWGDYAGRLRSVSLTAWNPDASPPAMRTVEVARYAYDTTGRLRSAWDPRLPDLRTTYEYDATGHVTTLTPPGEEPWSFGYAAIASDPDTGRLRSISRSALADGTSTWTVVYEVPASGAGAPHEISATEATRWAQSELPTDATAIFPPNQVPDDVPGTADSHPSSYERAVVHYLDAQGSEVNTGTPGGHLTATDYDQNGNVVGEITAANRRRALDASSLDTAAEEAALALRLSTSRVYAADGLRLVEELGPEHEVTLADGVTDSLGRAWAAGSIVRARARTANTYDEGAASGAAYHLVTTSTTGARIADTTIDADVRTTTMAYDWPLRQPTTVTTDPGGLNRVSRTSYDATTGLVRKSTLPGGTAAQDTAHTLVSTYYSAAANATYVECGGRPEWGGLVCRTDPAAQPVVTADRPVIPSTHYTYSMLNAVRTKIERNGGAVLRTWTTEFDAAGRPWKSSVTATTGTALPAVETVYNAVTGRTTQTRAVDGTGAVTATLTRTYDSLGRATSYTDSDGNVSTTTYDLLSRPVTTTDGKGSQTRHYDEGTERRGLLGRLVDSAAGTFTASYDADGSLVSYDYPNGLRATMERNETGATTRLTYAKGGSAWLSFGVGRSVHGQWLATVSDLSSQNYGYDAAGRLTHVTDKPSAGGCTTRDYTVDADSNRTAMVTRLPAGTDGACSATADSTVTATFDAASRITTSGYVYDTLGRTTTVPAPDSGGTAVTAAYHVNDLALSLTQGATAKTWTLDPTQQRFRSWTADGVTKVNHYADDGDSPAWVAESATAWSRNIEGIGGDLAAVHDSASGVTLQLPNLHGDVVATASLSTTAAGPTETFESTDFGGPRSASSRRYGWLGAKQRSADAIAGIVLMGVRLYNPLAGRFLQTDPVLGGSDNPYDYAGHDPVNAFDLDGRRKNDYAGLYGGNGTRGVVGAPGATYIPRKILQRGLQAANKLKFTKHGWDSALNHNGHGVANWAIRDTLRHPKFVESQAKGKLKFVGERAVVVINKAGKIVTTWPTSSVAYRNVVGWGRVT